MPSNHQDSHNFGRKPCSWYSPKGNNPLGWYPVIWGARECACQWGIGWIPDRWIGGGTANDKHIPWPPKSPDLTPMDYFLWGYIKSKVYVRNYEKLDDLKASVTAAFQEVSREMLSSTMANFGKRLKRSLKFEVAISRTKYVFMIYIVLFCFPILSGVKWD